MNKFKIEEQFSKSLNYPGIEKVILFGSVARHEDKKDSDIDILIISTNKIEAKDEVMRKVTEVLLEKGVYVSAKVFSPGEFERLKNTYLSPRLKKKVWPIDDARISMEGSEGREEADYGLLPEIGKDEAEIIISGADGFLLDVRAK
jgi:predicted nucleotidyltransferase